MSENPRKKPAKGCILSKAAGKKLLTSFNNEFFQRYSLNILSRFPEDNHLKSEFTGMGRVGLLKSPQKQTGARECAYHFVEIQSRYFLCLQNDLELLNPFVFNSNSFLYPLKTSQNSKKL